MYTRIISAAIFSILLAVVPSAAQVLAYSDERGNRVFVNEGPPPAPVVNPSEKAEAPASSPSQGSNGSARLTTPQELERLVVQTAEKHRVDPRLVRAVISAESNWNSTAVSAKGALGLMQLIPGTAQQLGVSDAFDPAQNVDAGVRYLAMMLDRYNGDIHRALAAYNAGPGAVDRFGGIPHFRETRDYVRKVTTAYLRGTGGYPAGVEVPRQIYRSVDPEGRVVFTNE
jgi:soluble lytic murein transglycosylase-like protein